ncbi:hypothetical protein MBLNU230_g4899t1 [Neophaeotheca triangularis]
MSIDAKGTPISGDLSQEARDLRMHGTKPVDFSKPLDLSVFQDKTALITGGVSGLGYGMTVALAENGAFVAMCDLNEQMGKEVEMELKGRGLNVQFIPTDVTNWDSQLSAFRTTLAASPTHSLDIVIPSAGLRQHAITDTTTPEATANTTAPPSTPSRPNTSTLDVNITGVYYTTSLALHQFHLQAPPPNSPQPAAFRPQLLLLASLAAYLSLPLSSDYNASKFAVRGLWKSVRHSSSRSRWCATQVNLLAPTYVRTPMVGEGDADALEHKGVRVARVGDVVQGALRALGDGGVEARAVAVCKGREVEGDMNFDLLDDPVHFDGGKVFLEMREEGRLGTL